MAKQSSGSSVLDLLLEGGYETDIVTMLYGPAGTGKTTTCLLASIAAAREKKVIFIDTEGGFSVERLQQLCLDSDKILENIMLMQPTNFEKQQQIVDTLSGMITPQIGLIVCDTISALYRTERGEDNIGLNRLLAKQIGQLLEIARTHNIPVLLSNQVYSDFDNKDAVKVVGGDIMQYNSKCLIEFKAGAHGNRVARLRKHRHLPEKEIAFKIVGTGFEAV